MPVPLRPNQRWSLDFLSDTFGACRKFRILAVNDDCCRENLALIQKSFSLGESDLFTLLRARAAAFEAEQSNNQQTIAQALARARLNQAQGVLP